MATIPNYSAPQSTIRQLLAVIAGLNVASRHATVVGPAYQVQRYGIDPDVTFSAFVSSGLTVPFLYKASATSAEETKPDANAVDAAFSRLFGKNLEAEYLASTSGFKLESLSQPSIIRLQGGSNVAGSNLLAGLRGRPVAVGDRAVITVPGGVRSRNVTGLVGKQLDAQYGSNTAKDDGDLANSDYNPSTEAAGAFEQVSAPTGFTLSTPDEDVFNGLVKGALLEGKYGAEFILTVATPGAPGTATFNIVSTDGLFAASNVASTNSSGSYSITSVAGLGGLVVRIATTVGNVVGGQQFRFKVFATYTRVSAAQLVLSDTGAGYTGPRDTTYTVRVKTGTASGYAGAVLEISDTAGVDTPTEVSVVNNTNFSVGSYGLRALFSTTPSLPPQGGLRTGDVFFVHAVAPRASTTEFDGIVLDGPAVDTSLFTNADTALTTVSLRIPFSGEILSTDAAGGEAWTVDVDEGIVVNGGLSLKVIERDAGYEWIPFVSGQGTLGSTWRALLPAPAQPIYVDDLDALKASHGRAIPENPLVFGAFLALDAGQAIYVMPVGSDDADGYSAALAKLENADKFYCLAGLSDERAVRQLFRNHVVTLSTQKKKRWRVAFVGTKSPGSYNVVGLTSLGGNFTATISSYSGGNRLVTAANFPAGDGFVTREVAAGDRFILGTGAEYAIESVLSQSELVLAAGPDSPISPATPFKVFKADTADSQAAFIAAESQALGDRRITNVWSEGGTAVYDGTLQVIDPQFLACYIAGQRAALAPQQGLTRRAVSAITSAAPTYTRYNEDQLNVIAAAGTLIVAEDADQGGAYIRHQLTTGVDGGLLYYEGSITAVADAISFQLKAIIDAFTGKTNVTSRTLARIDHNATAMLTAATQSDSATADIGPLLTEFRDLVVAQDPQLLDRVKLSVEADVAVPLNGVDASINFVPATITIAV